MPDRRQYTKKEAQFLGTEIADFIINNYKNNIVPDANEIVEFMQKAYGVPPEFTLAVLQQLFPEHRQNVVMFFFG